MILNRYNLYAPSSNIRAKFSYLSNDFIATLLDENISKDLEQSNI